MSLNTKSNPLVQSFESVLESRVGGVVVNFVLIPLLILSALLLPPISLADRLLSIGYESIGRDGGAIQPLRSSTSPSSARRAIRAPHSQSKQIATVDAGVQIAAVPVLGEEGVHVGQQAHGREPTAVLGRTRDQRAANRRRHPSPSTVQSRCLTFSHRLVGPPSYALASSLAT